MNCVNHLQQSHMDTEIHSSINSWTVYWQIVFCWRYWHDTEKLWQSTARNKQSIWSETKGKTNGQHTENQK